MTPIWTQERGHNGPFILGSEALEGPLKETLGELIRLLKAVPSWLAGLPRRACIYIYIYIYIYIVRLGPPYPLLGDGGRPPIAARNYPGT